MASDNELARLHAIIRDLRSDLFLYKVGPFNDSPSWSVLTQAEREKYFADWNAETERLIAGKGNQ